jgi:hypothetical protein
MAARSKGEATEPQNGLGRSAWAHLGPVACLLRAVSVPESSRSFPLLHVSPCCQFLSELGIAPCPARFDTFLGRSSEFVIFSGLVPGLLGVKFASLHDLYGASRSCHKVLDELIPVVLLSMVKPCINTKLQNRHARMDLSYQGGYYQWIRYKSYANTEGKIMARLTEFHRQHLPHA